MHPPRVPAPHPSPYTEIACLEEAWASIACVCVCVYSEARLRAAEGAHQSEVQGLKASLETLRSDMSRQADNAHAAAMADKERVRDTAVYAPSSVSLCVLHAICA